MIDFLILHMQNLNGVIYSNTLLLRKYDAQQISWMRPRVIGPISAVRRPCFVLESSFYKRAHSGMLTFVPYPLHFWDSGAKWRWARGTTRGAQRALLYNKLCS